MSKYEKIRLSGPQVFEDSDELLEGHAEISIYANDVLDLIDKDDIARYVRFNLDMMHEDEFKSSIDDFDKDDFIRELEWSNFRWIDKVDEDEMISHLESNGYRVNEEDIIDTLDIIDTRRLDEINRLFINGSWSEREEIYKKIFG